MMDKYSNFYRERSASREKPVREHEKPVDIPMPHAKQQVDESLGLRDPVQLLEQELGQPPVDQNNSLTNPSFIKQPGPAPAKPNFDEEAIHDLLG